ncbi:MAG: GreA/GreB family elongation factor [Candidatus Berkelbacteria bacterium]|nr:GreA/GreB family elongation factor [Candidatus Berkelbacteria bacterium]
MNKIQIGSKVVVKFEDDDEETYEIVDIGDADPLLNRISINSLFAKVLLENDLHSEIEYESANKQIVRCRVVMVDNL